MDFGLSDAVTVLSTWLDVAEWVMEAYYIPEQIVCNAWVKKGYAWFTNGKEVEDRDRGLHIYDDKIFYDDANLDSDVDLNEFEGEV